MNIAIVTGASSGMGKEFVKQMHRYVCVDQVWAIARREDALKALQEICPVPVRPIPLDLCDPESFPKFAAILEQEQPDVKLLVNAAGFGKFGALEKIPLEQDQRMIDLNCKALVAMTRLCLPYMGKGSHILQLDSLSAYMPLPYLAIYGATKAFVLSYSRAVHIELKQQGIRQMTMTPFWVRTEFFDHAFQTSTAEVQNFPRVYEAEDVVATGLRDLYKTGKQLSIHGAYAKRQVFLMKVLPHRIGMQIWLHQQKKAKNNQNLTSK